MSPRAIILFMMRRFAFPIVLFLTAFLPRAIYPVARSHVWHDRSIIFLNALRTGNFAETIQTSHPGIMTMWLVAGARWFGLTWLPDWYNAGFLNQSALEIIPLALVISLLIVLTYYLLSHLFNPLAAMVATLLLALDPFHISISKTIHVDTLMSMLLLVSALFILVLITQPERSQKRSLILSAIFGGIALLAKTPALFIVPYFLFCLLIWQLGEFISSSKLWPKQQELIQISMKIVRLSLLWAGVLVVSFAVLNPAFWVDPISTMNIMFTGTTKYAQTPHPNPFLFRGIITVDDPGILFYPITMALKTTAVVTITFIIGLPTLFMRQVGRSQRLTLWLMIFFILFFTIQMFLGSKKATRYVLPALQVIVLFAGVGTTLLLQKMLPQRQKLGVSLLLAVVLVQAVLSLPRHPYYGTHYNRLAGTAESILGSNLVAGQEQGEGLDLAAAYLNNLPNAVLSSASVQIPESFNYLYEGKTVPMTDDASDYLVFARNWLVRNMQSADWQDTWAAYEDRIPKYVVEFDGVPYVWVYKSGPEINEATVEHWLPTQVGNDLRFLGYAYEPKVVEPGGSVTLILYWEASQPTAADYTVFTHLIDEQGELVAQRDSQPQGGIYPTYLWDSGERIQDSYELFVPVDTVDGSLSFAIGMYTLATLERLPLQTELDLTIQDNRLLLPGPIVESNN